MRSFIQGHYEGRTNGSCSWETKRRSRAGTSPSDWAALAGKLEQQLGSKHYETWFSRLLCRSFTGERIQLICQNQFTKDWIVRRYLNDVQSAAMKVDGRRRVVQVLHEGEIPRSERVGLTPLGVHVPDLASRVAWKLRRAQSGSLDAAPAPGGGGRAWQRAIGRDRSPAVGAEGRTRERRTSRDSGPAVLERGRGSRTRQPSNAKHWIRGSTLRPQLCSGHSL